MTSSGDIARRNAGTRLDSECLPHPITDGSGSPTRAPDDFTTVPFAFGFDECMRFLISWLSRPLRPGMDSSCSPPFTTMLHHHTPLFLLALHLSLELHRPTRAVFQSLPKHSFISFFLPSPAGAAKWSVITGDSKVFNRDRIE